MKQKLQLILFKEDFSSQSDLAEFMGSVVEDASQTSDVAWEIKHKTSDDSTTGFYFKARLERSIPGNYFAFMHSDLLFNQGQVADLRITVVDKSTFKLHLILTYVVDVKLSAGEDKISIHEIYQSIELYKDSIATLDLREETSKLLQTGNFQASEKLNKRLQEMEKNGLERTTKLVENTASDLVNYFGNGELTTNSNFNPKTNTLRTHLNFTPSTDTNPFTRFSRSSFIGRLESFFSSLGYTENDYLPCKLVGVDFNGTTSNYRFEVVVRVKVKTLNQS